MINENENYYILPTSKTSFTMYYMIDALYQMEEYSTDYALVRDRVRAYIVKKIDVDVFYEDAKKMRRDELRDKYALLDRYSETKIKNILKEGFASTDNIFKSIYEGRLDDMLKEIEKFKSSLPITNDHLKDVKGYFDKEVQMAKEKVMQKTFELIDGSSMVEDKEETKERLRAKFDALDVRVVLTGKQSERQSSLANKNFISIACDEREIRVMNKGLLEGFEQNKNFQISVKGVLYHEMGHKLGELFGKMFSEAFSVKLQREMLKEQGLYFEIKDEHNALVKDLIESDEDREKEGNYEKDLIMRGKGKTYTFPELKPHYDNVYKTRAESRKLGFFRLNGDRNDTEYNVVEYADIYFEKDSSLQEVFDFNVVNNRLNDGRQLSVMEALVLEDFFENGDLSMEGKYDVLVRYVNRSNISPLMKLKMKTALKKHGLKEAAYRSAEYNTSLALSDELITKFISVMEEEAAKTEDERDPNIYLVEAEMGRSIKKLYFIVGIEKTKEMIDAYYVGRNRLGNVKRSTYFHTYLNSIYKREQRHERYPREIMDYISKKEELLTQVEEIRYLKEQGELFRLIKQSIREYEESQWQWTMEKRMETSLEILAKLDRYKFIERRYGAGNAIAKNMKDFMNENRRIYSKIKIVAADFKKMMKETKEDENQSENNGISR